MLENDQIYFNIEINKNILFSLTLYNNNSF